MEAPAADGPPLEGRELSVPQAVAMLRHGAQDLQPRPKRIAAATIPGL